MPSKDYEQFLQEMTNPDVRAQDTSAPVSFHGGMAGTGEGARKKQSYQDFLAEMKGGVAVPEQPPQGTEDPSILGHLKRGVLRLEQTAAATRAKTTGALLENLDTTPTARTEQMWKQLNKLGIDQVDPVKQNQEEVAALQQRISAIPQDPTMEKAIAAANNAPDLTSATKAFVEQVAQSEEKWKFFTRASAELLPQMLTMIVGTKGMGGLLPDALTGMSRVTAQMAGGGFFSSVANSYGPNVAEGLQMGLEYDQADARAALQSATQGGVDALTSAIIPWKIGPNQFTNIPAQTMIQMIGGAFGEVISRKAIGEEAKPGDVVAEGLLEVLGLPGDVVSSIMAKGESSGETGLKITDTELPKEESVTDVGPSSEPVVVPSAPKEPEVEPVVQEPLVDTKPMPQDPLATPLDETLPRPEETGGIAEALALSERIKELTRSLEEKGKEAAGIDPEIQNMQAAGMLSWITMQPRVLSATQGYLGEPGVKLEQHFADTDFTVSHSANRTDIGKTMDQLPTRPGALRVVGSLEINSEERRSVLNFIRAMQQKLMPSADIMLMSSYDMAQAFPGLNPESIGGAATFKDGGDRVYIGLSESHVSNNPDYTVHTASHEFGHALIAHEFLKASPEIQQALLNEYYGYLNSIVRGSWKKRLLSSIEPLWTSDPRNNPDYYMSFEEFAAQQMAKYVQTTKRGSSLLEKWYDGVLDALRSVYRFLAKRYKVTETFEEWYNLLADQVRLDKILAEPKPYAVNGKGVTPSEHFENITNVTLSKLDMPTAMLAGEETNEGVEPGPITRKPVPAKFGKFMRFMENLIQIVEQNQHVPGANRYLEAVRNWWTDKTAYAAKANDRLGDWKLGKTDSKAFDEFLYEATLKSDELGRALTPQEKLDLFTKHGFGENEDVQNLYENIQEDFHKAIRDLFDVLQREAHRKFSDNATELKQELSRLQKDQEKLLDRDFFPLSRFGRYWVHLKAGKETKLNGQVFKVGETISFEMYETQRQAEQRYAQLKRVYPGHIVGTSQVSEITETLGWMPPHVIEAMMERLSLTDVQREELQRLLFERAPGQSYKKHMLMRKGIAGFSRDSKRTYAAYFMHFSNYYSRIKHYAEMNRALQDVKDYTKRMGMGGNANSTQMLSDYLQRHYDYAMDPGNELANLRSVGFLWYLGFMPKSALVNLTQIPLVTYPYLAAKHGDVRAVKHLTKALVDLRKAWNSGKGMEHDVERAIQRGIDAGFLNESLATELAAVAEGSNLSRLMPGTFLRSERGAAYLRRINHYGAWLFQTAEKVNRLQTFVAAFRLAKDSMPGASEDVLFKEARKAVETTQYEYARWNRPEFMRGKKSVFFMFYQYLQNTLYFAAREPGRGRFLLMMLAMAGLQGLPGADDAMDLLDYALTRLGRGLGWKDPKSDIRNDIRELVGNLGLDPDLFMHGTSRVGFGSAALGEMMGVPIPAVDLSGSLSMGRIVPGVEPLFGREGDFNSRVMGVANDAGGAGVSAVNGLLQAIADDNPDTYKRWERAMPASFKSISQAYRWARDGGVTGYSDEVQVSMDPEDPQDLAEIVARGLGFRPTRVAKEQELLWSQRVHAQYYATRRGMLLKQFDHARVTRDREALADVKKAIRAYNASVPVGGLKISSKDIKRSQQRREQNRKTLERGLPIHRRETQLYRELEKKYGGGNPTGQ